MNSYWINNISAGSVVIPCIAALLKYNRLNREYLPFILMLAVALLNETISLLIVHKGYSNSINGNLYVLAEFLLITLQLYIWKERRRKAYLVFLITGLLIWIADNLVFQPLSVPDSVFRLYGSFVIVFLSIDVLNKMVVAGNITLTRNAVFLTCTAFCIYFGIKAFIEVYFAIPYPFSLGFYRSLSLMMLYVNLFINLLYAFAVIWIPSKKEFTWVY